MNKYTSSGSTLVSAANVRKLDAKRREAGHILGAPTVQWAWDMHLKLKEKYSYRDEVIKLFVSMVRLESPFIGDKPSISQGEVATDKGGRVRHTIAPAPFDVYTLGLSLTSDKHPYTKSHPMHKKHDNPEVMDKFDRFAQAILDMRMVRGDVLTDAAVQAIVTGWLPTMHWFDPRLIHDKQFPFDYQVLSPLSVFPLLNHRKQPILCTIEYEMTGAQLAEEFGHYQLVQDLFEAEIETPKDYELYKERKRYNGNIWDTKFKVVRYYDDVYTVLMISCGEAAPLALDYNTKLSKLHEKSKDGGAYSLFTSMEDLDDNEYAGVEQHNLGGMPIHLEGCWPDPMPPGSVDPHSVGSYSLPGYNSIVYYPFLYSMRPTWIDLSRLRSMQHTIVQKATRPDLMVKTDNIAKFLEMKKQGIFQLEPNQDEDVKYVQPPSSVDESFKFVINELKDDLQMGSYGKATFGSKAGQGGRQQGMVEEAGSVRQDSITRIVQRSLAAYPMGVCGTLLTRQDGGDEKVFVAGLGSKYDDGKGYTFEYSVKDLGGVCPIVTVELMAKQDFKEMGDVANFTTLKGTNVWADVDLLRMFGVVNPEHVVESAKKEALMKVKDVFAVDVELEVLKRQNELLKELWKERHKHDMTEDELQNELDKDMVAQKQKELPIEQAKANYQATLEELQRRAQEKYAPKPEEGPMGPPDPRMLGAMPPQAGPPPMGPMGGLPVPGNVHAAPAPAGPPPPQMGAPGPFGMRPLMPTARPMPPMPQGPAPAPVPPPGPLRLMPGTAKAPGQAQQPIQPPSRFVAPGGVGRPGVPSIIRPGQGGEGTPVTLPASVQEANKGVQLREVPTVNISNVKKHKRGKRG